MALLSDMTVDVVEMAGGTYHWPYTIINIDRSRPIVVRPATGATVVFSGSNVGGDPQFSFGFGGTAGNITLSGVTFDGYVLASQGIVQILDAHDLTLSDIHVTNSRTNGTTGSPYRSWAAYLGQYGNPVRPQRITLDRWTVVATGRQMSALQVYGGDAIHASGWNVQSAYYAIYASGSNPAITDFHLDGWTITDTGGPAWGDPNVAVAMEDAAGIYSNMTLTGSGTIKNVGVPSMVAGQ
jgi:hypothetical protein